MKYYSCFAVLLIGLLSCSKKVVKPSFIVFDNTEDSIHVSAVNNYKSPYHIRVERNFETVSDTVILFSEDKKKLISFSSEDIDTVQILQNYKFKTMFGNPYKASYDTQYDYQLPFPKHKSYTVLQGNNGDFSHKDRFSKYAVDFRMPVGDTVCAARNGFVVGIVKNNTKQGNDVSFRDFANFITLYHEDGTYSQYVHLKKNGVLVQLNQYVEKGQAIGLSGHTGWSTEPHLHFAVFKVLPFEFVSIPMLLDGKNSQDFKRWDLTSHTIQKDRP